MADSPPHIEVTIAAPAQRLWQALRDPDLIRRWHGWDYAGLDEEVQTIFIGKAVEDPANLGLTVEGGDRFGLHPVPEGTLVRLTRPAREPHAAMDFYDDITEGWRTFLTQLRFAVEEHDLAERKTLILEGELGRPTDRLVDALGLPEPRTGERYHTRLSTGDIFAGEVYARSGNQIAFTIEGFGEPRMGDGLLCLAQQPVTSYRPHGGVLAVLTTYGLPEAEFTTLHQRWTTWWEAASGRDD